MSFAPSQAASHAMTWPARYAFVDTLWRGRARLIVDPELERALVDWVGGRVPPDAIANLVESLVPRERAVPVWIVVGSDTTARLLAPHFPGARFLPVDTLDDRLARLPWETALIAIDRREPEPGDGEGEPTVSATGAESVALDVAAAMRSGRIAIVSAISNALDYESFAEQLRPTFGEAQIFGAYAPGMFAFVEFVAELRPVAGEFLMSDEHQTLRLSNRAAAQTDADDADQDADEDADAEVDEDLAQDELDDEGAVAPDTWDDLDDGEVPGDDDGAPLAFDNTLGPDDPPYAVWIGVVGAPDEFAEGLTLVEVPAAVASAQPRDHGGLPELRAQLQQSRALAESATLERQRLVERLDAALADNASLRDSVTRLREQLAGALDQPPAGERLDAALGREQSLRWRVTSLEREIAELRVRPVSELEAEVESLRARLDATLAEARASGERGDSRESSAHDAAPRGGLSDEREGQGDRRPSPVRPMPRAVPRLVGARRLASPRAGSGRAAALRVIEGLVRRIDHGVERATLRRELLALRRRLRG
jgi:hypothetical protein